MSLNLYSTHTAVRETEAQLWKPIFIQGALKPLEHNSIYGNDGFKGALNNSPRHDDRHESHGQNFSSFVDRLRHISLLR